MLVSTKGRYALRVMIDLAENSTEGYVPMNKIAARQEISLKYLERIVPLLVAGGLIEGVHGKGGGYRLTRKIEDYTAGEILRLTEGNLAPVSCLECDEMTCERAPECRTLPMWREFHKLANEYFDSVLLIDLMKKT